MAKLNHPVDSTNVIMYLARSVRYAWVRWRVRNARRYLLKNDEDFRLTQASLELVRQRDAFYEKGGDPADPKCPDLTSVLRQWGLTR